MALTITTSNNPSFKTLEDGKTEISFIADKLHSWDIALLREQITSLKADKLTIKVSKFRKGRSLDANSYLWILCQKLAEKLNITKEEVYREHIKHIGQFVILPIKEEAAETFILRWGMKGIGWVCEILDDCKLPGFKKIIAYYGSSTYDTLEMSKLIDNIVQDCKDQDIETLPPNELESLKEAWK